MAIHGRLMIAKTPKKEIELRLITDLSNNQLKTGRDEYKMPCMGNGVRSSRRCCFGSLIGYEDEIKICRLYWN